MGHPTTTVSGQCAEQSAFDYLLEQGLTPVRRNYRCRHGEIDLIMLDGECLTFVEVRYRASAAFAPARQTVDRRKQRKIICTAATFTSRNQRYATHTMRFDVVAIEGHENPDIEWIPDAFRPNDSTHW